MLGDRDALPDPPSSPPSWPDDEFQVWTPRIAADVAQLLANEPRWVLRRTETVTFNDEASLRRQTAVHFQLPTRVGFDDGTPTYVPLGLLEREVLTHFDVWDETGRTLPMLPRRLNALIAAELLQQQAVEALRALGQPLRLHPEIASALALIAGVEPPETEAASSEESSDDAAAQQAAVIRDDQIVRGLIEDIRSQFILMVPVEASSSPVQRIIKFAYDTAYMPITAGTAAGDGAHLAIQFWHWAKGRLLDALEVLGLRPFTCAVVTPAITDASSYHIEVIAPEEVICEMNLLHVSSTGELQHLTSSRGIGRVHLYTSDRGSDGWGYALLEFDLRSSLVWPVVLLSAVTTVTLLGGIAAHCWFGLPKRADAAATLVVALPTFFAPFVVPGSHPLVRRMFKGLRGLVLASALLAFVSAATLALNLRQGATISTLTAWITLASISSVLTVLSVLSLARSITRTRVPTTP